jgi:hypothetical protein
VLVRKSVGQQEAGGGGGGHGGGGGREVYMQWIPSYLGSMGPKGALIWAAWDQRVLLSGQHGTRGCF